MSALPSGTRFALVAVAFLGFACSVDPAGTSSSALGPGTIGHTVHLRGGGVSPGGSCPDCHAATGFAVDFSQNPIVLARSGAFDLTTKTCSNVYCHGNFSFDAVAGSQASPAWTDVTPLSCTSCHAMPPAGHPTYTGTPTAASCFQCHPQSVSADGTIKQGGSHLNGKADGGDCKSCHGDPPTTGKHTISDHRNRSCDACHPTGYTSTVAVAAFHQNGVTDLGTQAGYGCGLKACPTGTRDTCTNKCHGADKGAW